jgi:hypothetical protein
VSVPARYERETCETCESRDSLLRIMDARAEMARATIAAIRGIEPLPVPAASISDSPAARAYAGAMRALGEIRGRCDLFLLADSGGRR